MLTPASTYALKFPVHTSQRPTLNISHLPSWAHRHLKQTYLCQFSRSALTNYYKIVAHDSRNVSSHSLKARDQDVNRMAYPFRGCSYSPPVLMAAGALWLVATLAHSLPLSFHCLLPVFCVYHLKIPSASLL